jgi:hypothetical protein
MSRKAKTPEPVKTPFENNTVSEVENTPDIEAYRGFQPSTDILNAGVNAQFARAERQNADQFGAYSGIPSQVARNRMMQMGRNDLTASRGLALAEGNTQAQQLKMAQLESLANLTAKRKQQSSGFNSQLPTPPPSSGMGAAAIMGGATVLGSAMPAIIAA